MRLRPSPAVALALALVGLATAFVTWTLRHAGAPQPPCGAGFARQGARCVVDATSPACPRPFVPGPAGCAPPDSTVLIAAAIIAVGPSDWEAEDRAPARTIQVQAFRIDAFEVTREKWDGRLVPGLAADGSKPGTSGDPFRAASGMTRADAARFCERRGGRLPTEDEWTVAATSASTPPHRYPWGDTGAVCRRAAWGLQHGPCAVGAAGPDTVGAHADGDTPLGLHDIAGNVAEWVESGPAVGHVQPGVPDVRDVDIAKGGSWQTALATGLRVWARLELPAGASSDAFGFRCAYPP